MSFTIFWNEKNAFLRYKNKKSKKPKNWHFSKGLTHGFGPKMAIFLTFIFRQVRPRKCLLRYSKKKNAFVGYKTRSSKTRKSDVFPKGLTHGFGQKTVIFPTFFLGN